MRGRGLSHERLLFVLVSSTLFALYKLIVVAGLDLHLSVIYILFVFPFILTSPRLAPVFFLVCAIYLYLSSMDLSMVQLDSKKFYAEAFGGGYGSSVMFSTVDSTGFIYRSYAQLIGSSDPAFLVSINMLLHFGTVWFSLATIRLLLGSEISAVFIATPLLLSPLVLEYSAYLMKDFFVVWCYAGAAFFLVKWKLSGRKTNAFLMVAFITASSLFRLYALLYLVAFWIFIFRRLAWGGAITLLFALLMSALFGLKTILFVIYSFAAIFFVPNFMSFSSVLAKPLICLEGLGYFVLWAYVGHKALLRREWSEIWRLTLGLLFISCIYAFTSLYRIEMTTYESSGGYLTDNFLRKKLPVFYILYIVLVSSLARSRLQYFSGRWRVVCDV